MTNKEQIQAVRDAGFKKYDKVLHSKCGRPELYGIQRVPAAEEAIKAVKPPVSPRKDNRKFKHSVSCRLPKTEYVLLQQAFSASNEKTMQDYARRVLIDHAKEVLGKKKTATDAGTSEAVNKNNATTNIAEESEGVK